MMQRLSFGFQKITFQATKDSLLLRKRPSLGMHITDKLLCNRSSFLYGMAYRSDNENVNRWMNNISAHSRHSPVCGQQPWILIKYCHGKQRRTVNDVKADLAYHSQRKPLIINRQSNTVKGRIRKRLIYNLLFLSMWWFISLLGLTSGLTVSLRALYSGQ